MKLFLTYILVILFKSHLTTLSFQVLGQIDNKFIATIIKGKSDQSEFLVLFDQHAVHERIRLEDNLAGMNLKQYKANLRPTS